MDFSIKNASAFVGKIVEMKGWMYNKRSSGKIAFLQLRDGTGFLQGVVEKSNVTEDVWQKVEKLTLESSVIVRGTIKKHPKKDEFELDIEDLDIVQISPEYPIGKKEHGPEFLFYNRDLYLRSKIPWAVLKIRDMVFRSITNFFAEKDFVRTDTPILQPTSCEDTTQLFELDFYEEKMYLSQSGQLYSEAAIMSFGKVYDFGPVFRAEKSKTRNHLSEFWMMDAEMAFYDHDQSLSLQEEMVKHIISDVLENCKVELDILNRDTSILKQCATKPFLRKTHFEIKKELESDGFSVDFNDDLTTEEEIHIGNKYKIPVFVLDYPFEVKSFYMKSYVDDNGIKRAKCADLIAPEEAREIIGGSQREDDYDVLLKEMKERNYPISDYEWYLNIRKYGSVPHSGFGLGLERMVRWLSGVHHIRETIPFPRTVILNKP
jgi:asparaginyl-tRNA synthetase